MNILTTARRLSADDGKRFVICFVAYTLSVAAITVIVQELARAPDQNMTIVPKTADRLAGG